jgi:hypothetical protein
VLGWLVLVLMMLGSLGGIGWLVYTVKEMRSHPLSGLAADANPEEQQGENRKPQTTKGPRQKAEKTPPKEKDEEVKVGLKVEDRGNDTKPEEKKPPERKSESPLAALRRGLDFKTVPAGTLPEGWSGNPGSICVRRSGGRPGLHLLRDVEDCVTLPRVRLDADFVLETELSLPSTNASLGIDLETPEGGRFLVEIAGTGKMQFSKKATRESKAWKPKGEINTLRLERVSNNCQITLNGEKLESVELALPRGAYFNIVKLWLGVDPKASPRRSPLFHSIRLATPQPEG